MGHHFWAPLPHTDLIQFPYPFPKQGDTEVNFLLPKGLELGSPMVVHDKSEVCVHSHGDEDAALQDPLPAEREDTAPTSSLDLHLKFISDHTLRTALSFEGFPQAVILRVD